MANTLTNPTPLNVPAPATTKGTPAPSPTTFATPHVGAPPVPAVSGHTVAPTTTLPSALPKKEK